MRRHVTVKYVSVTKTKRDTGTDAPHTKHMGRIKIKKWLIKRCTNNTSGFSKESNGIQSIFTNHLSKNLSKSVFAFIVSIAIFAFCSPGVAEAGFFDVVGSWFSSSNSQTTKSTPQLNSQNIPLLSTVHSNQATGGAQIKIEQNALVATPVKSISKNTNKTRDYIDTYVVREGDTLSEIADMFDISVETIKITNDIKGSIRPGQELVILPVSGVQYTIKNGGTLKDVVANYTSDKKEQEEILKDAIRVNNLDPDKWLEKGTVVIIPDAVPDMRKPTDTKHYKRKVLSSKTRKSNRYYKGYYIRPVNGGVKTQGYHGYNAVDIGIPVGTPVYASASGVVLKSRSSGWNYGYGKYVMLKHGNGTKTVYAHMSAVYVTPGQSVKQGQVIGLSGNTGRSTGPHLHFEIRGTKNPF